MREERIEEIVLGAILLEKDAFHIVSNILDVECFTGWHSDVYQSVVDVSAQGKPVDLLTVCDNLKEKRSNIKPYEVASLTNKVASTANIEAHAWILKNKSVKSKLNMLGLMIAQETEKDNVTVTEIIDKVQERFNQITLSREVVKPEMLREIITRELAERANRKGGTLGTPTGLSFYDKVIGGLYCGVHVIGARPAMGKTAFAVSVAVNACNHMPVCFWSGEMTRDKIALRIESYLTGIPTERLRLQKINDSERNIYNGSHSKMMDLNIEIDDTPSLKFSELRIKCLKWQAKHGQFILVLDYLGLLDDGGDEYRGVTQNSKQIHALANELQIPILLLHQLSRNVEQRADRMPQLSDLRGSGGIEQDADTVTFLYRPEYYDLNVDPITGAEVEHEKAYALVRKNREGITGEIELRFIGQASKYEDWHVENYQHTPF